MDLLGHVREVAITPFYRKRPIETLRYSYAKWKFALHRIYTPEEFLEGLGIPAQKALNGYARWRPLLEEVVRKVKEKQGHQGGVSA